MSHPDDESGAPRSDAPVSKTQMKKRMLALQALGESLIALPASQYDALDLPAELRDAVDAARGMTKRGALHRQRQFIGKVMRRIDAAPIEAALERLQGQDRHAARDFHRIEGLRDRLLADDGDAAFGETCEAFPRINRQQLRHKLRAARREATTGAPRGAGRALFRFLKAQLDDPDSASS